MAFADSLGVVLRLYRNKKNLSQIDVAAAADKERAYISDVENGRRNVSMDTFLDLCRGVDVDPRVILDDALKRIGQ